MSAGATSPALSREGPCGPPVEIQKQTILGYLTAFGLAFQLTESDKLRFIEIAQGFASLAALIPLGRIGPAGITSPSAR